MAFIKHLKPKPKATKTALELSHKKNVMVSASQSSFCVVKSFKIQRFPESNTPSNHRQLSPNADSKSVIGVTFYFRGLAHYFAPQSPRFVNKKTAAKPNKTSGKLAGLMRSNSFVPFTLAVGGMDRQFIWLKAFDTLNKGSSCYTSQTNTKNFPTMRDHLVVTPTISNFASTSVTPLKTNIDETICVSTTPSTQLFTSAVQVITSIKFQRYQDALINEKTL